MSNAFNESGQMLLIAVLIAVLALMALPIMVLVNQMGTHQHVASLQATLAETTAVSGITYAANQLAPVWPAALAGNFTGTDCNQGTVRSPSGIPFTLACDQSGRPYEIHVVATARTATTNSVMVSSRSVEAYLSLRTVGIKLINNYTASAALFVVNTPAQTTNNSLSVHWGPVVCLSSDTLHPWTLYDPLNSQSLSAGRLPGFPRKFSSSGITGNGASPGDLFYRVPDWLATSVSSDQKEFWAFAAQTVGPQLNDAGYQSAAQAGPTVTALLGSTQQPISGSPGGYFSVSGDTIVFDGSLNAPAGSMIYVNGNAEFDHSAIDLSTGALIVTGNLTLNNVGSTDGLSGVALNVPPSAALEYAYYGPSDAWPCQTLVGLTCTPGTPAAGTLFSPTGQMNFRGFLWVQGTLTVYNNWNMAGVIVAGNPSLQTGGLATYGDLTLAYDDIVNHNILTATTELQSDIFRDIPAR